MAYTPTIWKNGEFPPIDAEHLNKIEQGIANSAPGGFGLGGEAKLLTANDNLDDIWRAGWYAWDTAPQNAPIIGGTPISYCSMIVLNKGGDYMKTQAVFSSTGSELHRANNGLGWTAWEWVNPPMNLGVEYRTTERDLGKPVYVKVVDCGQIADGKEVEHGIPDMGTCIMAQGMMGGLALPRLVSHDLSNEWSAYISQVYSNKIRFECGTSVVGNNISVILKYTKNTD